MHRSHPNWLAQKGTERGEVAPKRWYWACAASKFHAQRYSALIGAQSATLDRTFFALSDPTRRGILERLAIGPATIGELAQPLHLTLNGVKKHVGILESVDLVITAKVGRSRECRLGPAQLANATTWIEDYRRVWQRRLDRFGAYVEQR